MGLKKYRICFIGGGPTIESHIKSFSKLKNVELTAIFNRTKKKSIILSKKYNIKFVSDNIEDLYLKFKADAVIVAVSIEATKLICSKIFKFNWVCFVEKPLGYNFKEAKEIIKISKMGLSRVYVAMNRRNYDSVLFAKKEVEKIRGSRFIEINDQQNFPYKKNSNKIKNNWFYANSIHMIDLLISFGRGKIFKIKKLSNFSLKKKNYYICEIFFSSGDIALYKCAWNLPGDWALNITTTKIKYSLSPLNKIFYQDLNSKKMSEIKLTSKKNLIKDGFRNQAYELIKLLKKKNFNLLSIENSLVTMQLIKNIYK